MRRKEKVKVKGWEWEPLFFTRSEDDSMFQKLVGQAEQLNADVMGGVWRYDEEKSRRARIPYHADITPTGWGVGREYTTPHILNLDIEPLEGNDGL